MSVFQKVIKRLALAFALFLVVSIFAGIFSAFCGVAGIFGDDSDEKISEMSAAKLNQEDAKVLIIDIHAAELEMKEGEKLAAETNNSDITITQKDGKLQIKEKGNNWFKNSSHSKVVVYIPKNMEFDKVDIDTGAGEITIDSLITDVLDMDLGAGEVNIDYIEAREVADIDGGTGETTIKSGKLSNLSFDLGVGEAELTSELRGDCDMDLGVGSLALTILGEKDDYTIEVNKGIGEYSIDGEKIHDNDKIGEGNNHLQIDGGIGDAKINFKENR